jgi:hypothetical protein
MTLTLDQHLEQRVDDAEHPNRAHDSPAARHQPESDLRLTDLHTRHVGDDAVMAGQSDLQPATQRGAVDRGHHRTAQRLEPTQHALDRHGLVEDLARVRGCGLD